MAPMRVDTLTSDTMDTALLGKALRNGRDAYMSGLKEKLPLHRLVTAAEAGAAVVFLMINGGIKRGDASRRRGIAAGLSAVQGQSN